MPPTTTRAAATVTDSGWQPSDTIALGALLVAIATLWLTLRYQERARREDRAEARRREAGLALGPSAAF